MIRKIMPVIIAAAAVLIIAGVVVTVSLSSSRRLSRVPQEINTGDGAIEGRVLDSEGQPVSGALVTLDKVGSWGSTLLPTATTDENGGFRFPSLAAGEYKVYAGKEEDGYPDTRFELYHTGVEVSPQVTVRGGRVASDVIVRLGPRAIKMTGKVIDEATGLPVENPSIIIRRLDNPNAWRLTGLNKPEAKGEFELLVPTIPVEVEVSAPGYEKKNTGSLHLIKGEIKRLDVTLRPHK